jgi:membrane-associated phospholipid phosphatase
VTHENLAYYGGAADRIACYTALGLATATGLLRVTSNNHYLSDIVVGAVIGLSMGYLLPRFVYFGDDPVRTSSAPLHAPAPPLMQFGGQF